MNKEMKINGIKVLVTAVLLGMLIACGGGGGGSGDENALTSEAVVARGVITQLGSIWVLGVEYETPNGGSYSNDDKVSSVANYQVGQWVRIRGRRNDDHISGVADEVEYEAELEGVADVNGNINGIAIVPSSNINAPGIPDPLTNGVRYEVSGLWLDEFTIEATYIKEDDDGDDIDEIKGFVENDGPTSFDVRGITFNYTGTPDVVDGDFVEVHFDACGGTSPDVTCTATRVEFEDDYNDEAEGQEAEYEGTVNMTTADIDANCPGGVAGGTDFMIEMTCIDWDSMSLNGWRDGLTGPDDMKSGMRVEAEGHFNLSGVLIAEKIKGRGNRVRITSTATNVDGGAGTFDLFFGDIQVTTISGVTEYELDNLGTSVNDISDTDGLEVRGIRTGPTSLLALRIKSESVAADKYELRAEVDLNGADAATNTITVMGISSVAGADTELKLEDTEIASGDGTTTEADIDSFLNMIDDDDIVNTSNGPRDVIEVDIDTTNGGDGTSASPYSADEIEIEEEDD
jgi:hypothetical protein